MKYTKVVSSPLVCHSLVQRTLKIDNDTFMTRKQISPSHHGPGPGPGPGGKKRKARRHVHSDEYQYQYLVHIEGKGVEVVDQKGADQKSEGTGEEGVVTRVPSSINRGLLGTERRARALLLPSIDELVLIH